MHNLSQTQIDLILSLRKSGKTYNEIVRITGSCKGTISKYCVEAGLSENPTKVKEFSADLLNEILQRYYEIGNIKEVAKEYNTSAKRLRFLGIKVNTPKKDYSDKGITPLASCALKTKLKAVEYKGGCCLICGYNKSIRALQFHHLDPSKKEYSVTQLLRNFTSEEILKTEVDKCILLCANCHRLEHNKNKILL